MKKGSPFCIIFSCTRTVHVGRMLNKYVTEEPRNSIVGIRWAGSGGGPGGFLQLGQKRVRRSGSPVFGSSDPAGRSCGAIRGNPLQITHISSHLRTLHNSKVLATSQTINLSAKGTHRASPADKLAELPSPLRAETTEQLSELQSFLQGATQLRVKSPQEIQLEMSRHSNGAEVGILATPGRGSAQGVYTYEHIVKVGGDLQQLRGRDGAADAPGG